MLAAYLMFLHFRFEALIEDVTSFEEEAPTVAKAVGDWRRGR